MTRTVSERAMNNTPASKMSAEEMDQWACEVNAQLGAEDADLAGRVERARRRRNETLLLYGTPRVLEDAFALVRRARELRKFADDMPPNIDVSSDIAFLDAVVGLTSALKVISSEAYFCSQLIQEPQPVTMTGTIKLEPSEGA